MTWYRDATEGYVWHDNPSVVHQGGPTRVVTDQPDPGFVPRPVGFTAHPAVPAVAPSDDQPAPGEAIADLDPDLEGDQA